MDLVRPRSRRAVLAGALGGVAAAAASSLIRPSSVGAANGDPLLAGQGNTATQTTSLTNSTAGSTTLSAVASGTGSAILATGLAGRGITGSTQTGIAVRAVSSGTGYAVYATSTSSLGVWASSSTGTALKATSGGQGADISSSSTTVPSLVSKSTGGSVGLVGLGGNFVPAGYPDGVGVLGDNPDAAGIGVWGRSSNGTALLGESDTGYGLEGYGSVGVYASGGSVGVLGDVDNATGVQGWSGVEVAPDSGVDVGVWAGAENGRTALKVQGVVRMNRSGRVSIGATKSSVVVTVPGGLGSTSLGFAALQTNRAGYYVQAVVVTSTTLGQITIYLNKALTTATFVAWVVIG